MRSVKVEYLSSEKEKPEAFQVSIERAKDDGTWTLAGRNTVPSGQTGEVKTYLLEPKERLVIEPFGSEIEMIFDKEQNAAMPRSAFESQPTQAQKEQTEVDRQKEVRDITFGDDKAQRVGDRAAEQARDVAIEEQRLAEKKRLESAKADAEANKAKVGEPVRPSDELIKQPNQQASVTTKPTPGTTQPERTSAGGMTAPGPSTGGQSSKDVKEPK